MTHLIGRLFIAIFLLMPSLALAQDGLVIHASEFIIAKFHRFDNQVNPYPNSSAWKNYVLPKDAPTDRLLSQKNADGSFSIFFSNLAELMASVVQLSRDQGRPISVLNIHGHGLPGLLFFPKDAAALADWHCVLWRQSLMNSDRNIYYQYYIPETAANVKSIHQTADNPNPSYACMSGLKEWQEELSSVPEFKAVFAANAQIHFLACLTGLGAYGQTFTQGIAELLLAPGRGHVEAAMDLGLGDWSMVQGMGFWDYQSDAQVDHDEKLDSTDHKDAEIAQKGSIRLAAFTDGKWQTSLVGNMDFMSVGFDSLTPGLSVPENLVGQIKTSRPAVLHIPGTAAWLNLTTQ